MLRSLLEQGLDIIIDETNVTAKKRAIYLDLAREYGYDQVEALVVPTNVQTCKLRAAAAGDTELWQAIDRMHKQWEDPSYEEGFDYIDQV